MSELIFDPDLIIYIQKEIIRDYWIPESMFDSDIIIYL